MADYQLTAQADLGVLYEITRMQHSAEEWQKITHGLVTREHFIGHCIEHGLDSLGFSYAGRPIGGVIFDGQAAHIAVHPEHHGRWGFLWKKTLSWVFAHKDPIEVKIHAGNEKAHRLMERNNWPRIHADENFVTYQMSSKTLPHYFRCSSSD